MTKTNKTNSKRDTQTESSFAPLIDLTVTVQDSMAEAGRKILTRYFQEMLEHEPIAHLGEDIEGVHKMRVATRRIRSIYRILKPYSPPIYYLQFPQYFRYTARVLGGVRDLDVFLQRIHQYIKKDLGGDASSLQGLLNFKQSELNNARYHLLSWLDSNEYQQMTLRFQLLLQQPTSMGHLYTKKSRVFFSYQVNHELPLVLYQCYHAVRRYETVLNEQDIPTIHEMRVEAKRLRYTLDAFSAVLGDSGALLIAELKEFQEVLGDLNDMAVAIQLLNVAVDAVSPDQREGILTYREKCDSKLQQYLSQLLPAWDEFHRGEVRTALGAAAAQL